jgi:predicted transcriptional regulator YdeE
VDLATVELGPLDVMRVRQTGNMPEIAGQAFERLETALPSMRGRKFYGYWDPKEKAYFACVVMVTGDDAAALGLDRSKVPGGRYRRARLKGEPAEIYPKIGTTFEEMRKEIPDVDHQRPWLEFYRERDVIDLLVPVK